MPLPTQPQGTLERVYTALYVLDAGGEAGNDHALYLHPNGRVICVTAASSQARAAAASRNGSSLTRAPPHLRSVRFAGGEDGGAPAPVSGKHKRNSLPFLRPVAVLARVSAQGQPTFGVRTCVRGALLEANERLLAAPGLLRDAPHCEGFVAILRPADGALNELRATALTQDAYRAALAARDAQAATQQ